MSLANLGYVVFIIGVQKKFKQGNKNRKSVSKQIGEKTNQNPPLQKCQCEPDAYCEI